MAGNVSLHRLESSELAACHGGDLGGDDADVRKNEEANVARCEDSDEIGGRCCFVKQVFVKTGRF